LQLRVQPLQRLELLEVPLERPARRLPVDGGRRLPRDAVVGPRVAALTDDIAVRIRRDVAEGVVDGRQAIGRSARLDVLDGVAPSIDAPLDVVADDLAAAGELVSGPCL